MSGSHTSVSGGAGDDMAEPASASWIGSGAGTAGGTSSFVAIGDSGAGLSTFGGGGGSDTSGPVSSVCVIRTTGSNGSEGAPVSSCSRFRPIGGWGAGCAAPAASSALVLSRLEQEFSACKLKSAKSASELDRQARTVAHRQTSKTVQAMRARGLGPKARGRRLARRTRTQREMVATVRPSPARARRKMEPRPPGSEETCSAP